MIPQQYLYVFYAICGLIILGALLRIAFRNRSRRAEVSLDSASAEAGTVRSAASGQTSAPETAAPPAVPSRLSILRSQLATSPGIQRSAAGETDDAADDLPDLEPHDVPGVDESDLVFGPMTRVFAALLPESPARLREQKKELAQAGYYQPHALINFAAVRYVLMMAGLILGGLGVILAPPQLELPAMILVLILPLLGWAVPRLVVRSRAADRLAEIERGLPDMLDMLNMCVSQGLTIGKAIGRVARDLRGVCPALAQELAIVTQQAKVGTLEQALDNFANRIDLPEVKSFASLIVQTERMGTSVAGALIEYSDTMREGLRQRADEKANQAAFKMLFPTVLCLMPAIYIFLLGPALIELSEFFTSGGAQAVQAGASAVERITTQRAGR